MPRRLLQIVLAGALLLCARPAAAEVSIWLKKGVSGFGSWFGFTGVDDGSFSLALGGGYSYEGVLELDLAVSRGFPDSDQLGGASLAIWIIESSIEVHPLKQSATFPISLGVAAGVSFPFISSDDLDARGISVSAFGYSFGLSAYRFFRLGESLGITPAVGLRFAHLDMTFKTALETIDRGESTFGGTIGAYLAFIDSGGRIWGLAPSALITDDFVQFQILFGVVFGMP